MKLTDLKLIPGNKMYGPNTGMYIHRHWVTKAMLVACHHQGLDAISHLNWSKPRTSKEIYGDPDWPTWAVGKRIAIGRCIRLFADCKILNLVVLNPKAKGTKKYGLSKP